MNVHLHCCKSTYSYKHDLACANRMFLRTSIFISNALSSFSIPNPLPEHTNGLSDNDDSWHVWQGATLESQGRGFDCQSEGGRGIDMKACQPLLPQLALVRGLAFTSSFTWEFCAPCSRAGSSAHAFIKISQPS